MPDVVIRTVTDLVEARALWERWSPKKMISDFWEYRVAFLEAGDTPLFLVADNASGEPEALFALECHPDGSLDKFGAGTVSVLGNQDHAEALLAAVPGPLVIESLTAPYKVGDRQAEFSKDYFSLSLRDLGSTADFMNARWPDKRKKRIQKEALQLQEAGPVEVTEGNEEDLEKLFAFNLNRFGSESIFHDPAMRKTYRTLYQTFNGDVLVLTMRGNVVAVTFALQVDDWYVGMNNGVEASISNLGKFVNLAKIDRAIQLKKVRYDAGFGDYGGWKTSFAFDTFPLYRIELP